MSDLIERQAAIDAAIEAADEWDGGCNPEREKAIRTAIMALLAANRWIPPFEVDCEGFGIWQEHFHPVSLGSLGSEWVEIPVTAWMPLPEPYTKEEEE